MAIGTKKQREENLKKLQAELRRIAKEKGLAQEPWSLQANQGRTFVKDILRGKSTNPGSIGLRALAEAAGLDPGHFSRFATDDSANALSAIAEHDTSQPRQYSPSGPITYDLPLYKTAGNGTGEFLMSAEKERYVSRPPGLMGRADVFVCFVETSVMEPRHFSGDLIFLGEDRSPKVNECALIEIGEVDGKRRMLLREVVSINDTTLEVAQIAPKATAKIKRSDIVRLYRVLPTSDLI